MHGSLPRPLLVNTCDRPADPAPTLSPEAVARMDARATSVRAEAARFNDYAAGRLCSFNDPAWRAAEDRRFREQVDAMFGRGAQ